MNALCLALTGSVLCLVIVLIEILYTGIVHPAMIREDRLIHPLDSLREIQYQGAPAQEAKGL